MENCIYPAVLPDITMYGGDTDTWEISLYRDENTPYAANELAGYECSLDILPMTDLVYKTGVSSDPLVLSKAGKISFGDDVGAYATFDLWSSDTLNLRGIYIYQISISFNSIPVRVIQGKLTIIPNVKRGVL